MAKDVKKQALIRSAITHTSMLSAIAASILTIVAICTMDPAYAAALFDYKYITAGVFHGMHSWYVYLAFCLITVSIMTLLFRHRLPNDDKTIDRVFIRALGLAIFDSALLPFVASLILMSHFGSPVLIASFVLFLIVLVVLAPVIIAGNSPGIEFCWILFFAVLDSILLAKLASVIFVSHFVSPVLIASFVLSLIPLVLLAPAIIAGTSPNIATLVGMIGVCAAVITCFGPLFACGIAICLAALLVYCSATAAVFTIEGSAYVAGIASHQLGFQEQAPQAGFTPKNFPNTNMMITSLSDYTEAMPTMIKNMCAGGKGA